MTKSLLALVAFFTIGTAHAEVIQCAGDQGNYRIDLEIVDAKLVKAGFADLDQGRIPELTPVSPIAKADTYFLRDETNLNDINGLNITVSPATLTSGEGRISVLGLGGVSVFEFTCAK
jgi:hypothetical protein